MQYNAMGRAALWVGLYEVVNKLRRRRTQYPPRKGYDKQKALRVWRDFLDVEGVHTYIYIYTYIPGTYIHTYIHTCMHVYKDSLRLVSRITGRYVCLSFFGPYLLQYRTPCAVIRKTSNKKAG